MDISERGIAISDLAEEFQVCARTVRRAAIRLGVEGVLRRRGSGSIRVFGTPEVERLRAYFREHAPQEEEPDNTEGEGGDQVDAAPNVGQLALPPTGHVAEFLDLLADLRDQLAKANAREERAIDENRQLREVLAARLPAPSPPAPQPRVRWRACTEVALLGVVTVLAGAMVAAVARVLQINGAIVLPW